MMRAHVHLQEDDILRELVKRHGTKKCELVSKLFVPSVFIVVQDGHIHAWIVSFFCADGFELFSGNVIGKFNNLCALDYLMNFT